MTRGAEDGEEVNSHQPVTSVTPITKSVHQAMAEFPLFTPTSPVTCPGFLYAFSLPSPNFSTYNIPNNLNESPYNHVSKPILNLNFQLDVIFVSSRVKRNIFILFSRSEFNPQRRNSQRAMSPSNRKWREPKPPNRTRFLQRSRVTIPLPPAPLIVEIVTKGRGKERGVSTCTHDVSRVPLSKRLALD